MQPSFIISRIQRGVGQAVLPPHILAAAFFQN